MPSEHILDEMGMCRHHRRWVKVKRVDIEWQWDPNSRETHYKIYHKSCFFLCVWFCGFNKWSVIEVQFVSHLACTSLYDVLHEMDCRDGLIFKSTDTTQVATLHCPTHANPIFLNSLPNRTLHCLHIPESIHSPYPGEACFKTFDIHTRKPSHVWNEVSFV